MNLQDQRLFETEVIKEKVVFSYTNIPSFKNTINSEILGDRSEYFHGFHISMIPTTGENFKKIHARVTCSRIFVGSTWNYPIKNMNLTDTNYH